jgi:hypothetical protein
LTHDNLVCPALLAGYLGAGEACQEHPWFDSILSGVLTLRTAGDSSTRALSRKVLFSVLQWCPVISVEELQRLLGGRYQSRTVERYAAVARVAAKAVEAHVWKVDPASLKVNGIREARQWVDEPYVLALAEAERAALASQDTASRPAPHLRPSHVPTASSRFRLADLVE